MKYTVLIYLVLYWACSAMYAQDKYDYTWVIGYQAFQGFDPDSNVGLSIIPFEKGIDSMYYLNKPGKLLSTNACIADPETGELLFYADGCRIYNRHFEVMENGSHMNYGIRWHERCEVSDFYPVANSALILPRPGYKGEYYIIHQKDTIVSGVEFGFYIEKLFYTHVSFNENDLGIVVDKNVLVTKDDSHWELMDAVRHVNGIDWWVYNVRFQSNEFLRFLVTGDSVYFEGEQGVLPFAISNESFNGGTLAFSPDGSKLVLGTRYDDIHLFDFDRGTGLLSNHQIIFMPDTTFTFFVNCSFSPNSRYLYFNNSMDLWQADTWEEDLDVSVVHIGEWDCLVVGGFFPTSFGVFAQGPDCKLYMSTLGTNKYMHVIHHPDLPGAACGFEQRGIELASVSGEALPLQPNYRLGTGPVCDPSLATSSTASPLWVHTVALSVRPNPTSGQVWVGLAESPPGGRLVVYDTSGREVYRHTWPGEEHSFSAAGWPPGLYFLNYYDPQGRYASGKLVVE